MWMACLALARAWVLNVPRASLRLQATELVEMSAPRGYFLVNKWKQTVEHDVALGFLPAHIYPHRSVPRLMRSRKLFKEVYYSCGALAASKEVKGPLRGGKIVSTPRSKIGAALAVIREKDDVIDVLHVVTNPDIKGEELARAAEAEIIAAIRNRGKRVRIAAVTRDCMEASDAELAIAPFEVAPSEEDSGDWPKVFEDERVPVPGGTLPEPDADLGWLNILPDEEG